MYIVLTPEEPKWRFNKVLNVALSKRNILKMFEMRIKNICRVKMLLNAYRKSANIVFQNFKMLCCKMIDKIFEVFSKIRAYNLTNFCLKSFEILL